MFMMKDKVLAKGKLYTENSVERTPVLIYTIKTTIAIILNCFLSIVWPESDLFRDSFNSKVDQ